MKKPLFFYFYLAFCLAPFFSTYADSLNQLPLDKFLQTLRQPTPEITGGAALSITTAMSASLCEKVAALNLKHHHQGINWGRLQLQSRKSNEHCLTLAQQDINTFKAYLQSTKAPHSTNKNVNIQIDSIQTLLAMMQEAHNVMQIASLEKKYSLPFFQSDAASAYQLAFSALKSTASLLDYDIESLPNQSLKKKFIAKKNYFLACVL